MTFIDLWNRFLAEQREARRLETYRGLSTEQLKAAWDAFGPDAEEGAPGYFWPADGPHIEDVHRLLKERGEGDYCAV